MGHPPLHRAARIISAALAAMWLSLLGTRSLAAGAASPRLSVEYLPTVVYDDDPITVCARVEAGAGPPSRFLYSASLLDASGRAVASDIAKGAASEGKPWRRASTLRIDNGQAARLEVRLASVRGSKALGAVALPLLNGRRLLPPLQARGVRLVDAKGRRVIVRIEHRVRKPKETWPIIRWVYHRLYGDRWAFRRPLVLGDDLGAPRRGFLARAAAAVEGTVIAVPSQANDVAVPILRAVAALSRHRRNPRPDLAVLCLGHCDADFGSDVLEFQRAMGLVLQQLEARGCHQFVLVAPVGPPHLRKRLAPYVRAVRHTAFTYQSRFLDPTRQMTEAHWAGERGGGGLVLRLPNAAGHAVLGDTIARYLRKIRR